MIAPWSVAAKILELMRRPNGGHLPSVQRSTMVPLSPGGTLEFPYGDHSGQIEEAPRMQRGICWADLAAEIHKPEEVA
jgi:hypothetical protein